MRLAIITDELSADLETALELAGEMEVGAVELRGVGEARFPRVGDYWQLRVPELISEAGTDIAAISPGLFKIPYPSRHESSKQVLRWEDAALTKSYVTALALVEEHVERILPETIASALDLGAPTIVCFSFDREDRHSDSEIPDAAIDVLRHAAHVVGKSGLTLAVEVEHICYGSTADRVARIVERVGHPSLGINWDPANAYLAGDDRPYPDGYAAVRGAVRHVHFKDAWRNPETGKREFILRGAIDWDGQIAALRRDRYRGFVSVETHARPKVQATRLMVRRARSLGIDA